MTPIRLRNVVVLQEPLGAAARVRSVLSPAPGRVRRLTLPANVRGLWAAPGVASGVPYVVAGSALYALTPTWGFTYLGDVVGTDVAQMRGLRKQLIIRSGANLYYLNGGALSQVSDTDAPDDPSTLAVVGTRVVAAYADGDAFAWSKAGLPGAWDAAGLANDINLPDPIVGQEELLGQLVSFNSKSIQFWRPTAEADEASAFTPLEGVDIRRGLIGRDTAQHDASGNIVFLADNRVLHVTTGATGIAPIPDQGLEEALIDISDDDLANAVAFVHRRGSREYYVLNVGRERAYALDLSTRTFSERTRYGASAYDLDFACEAFGGQTLVAGRGSPYIWTLENDTHTDDGDPRECEMTVHVPAGGGMSIDRLVFDMQVRDQPAAGTGSAPKMMLTFYRDGGRLDSLKGEGIERTLELPSLGHGGGARNGARVQAFRFGKVDPEAGFLLKIRITDPIRFAIRGLFVNPTDRELL